MHLFKIYTCLTLQTGGWQHLFLFFSFPLGSSMKHIMRQSEMLIQTLRNSTLDMKRPVKRQHISCKCLPLNIPLYGGLTMCIFSHTTLIEFPLLVNKVLCTYYLAKIRFDWFANDWQWIICIWVFTCRLFYTYSKTVGEKPPCLPLLCPFHVPGDSGIRIVSVH